MNNELDWSKIESFSIKATRDFQDVKEKRPFLLNLEIKNRKNKEILGQTEIYTTTGTVLTEQVLKAINLLFVAGINKL